MIKKLRYFIEYIIVRTFVFMTKILPISIMSSYYAMVFYVIGSKLPADKTAEKNLKFVFPKKSSSEIKKIKENVWKNLGHNFAEFAYFSKLSKSQFLEHVKVSGIENLAPYTEKGIPILFYGGHFSNWELMSIALKLYEIKTNIIYRKINNDYLDDYVLDMRSSKFNILHAKGLRNATKIVNAVKKGECFASLIDQKLTQGIEVPFFGKKTKTPPLIAQLAIKFDLPLIGVNIKRIDNMSYELKFEEILKYKSFENKDKQIREIMLKINQKVEKWIIDAPEQWFFVHNRW
ncbi:MAG: hypothetical protein ISQ32_04010 [Rickettsiales bacterium]|nr:hypothetical protein [Rickettsiales bacterium]